MWNHLKAYIKDCTVLSLKASYDAANNVLGAAFGAGATVMSGSIAFIGGTSKFIQGLNGGLTVIFYTAIAWIFLLVFRALFIAPFLLYFTKEKRIEELEEKMAPKVDWHINKQYAITTNDPSLHPLMETRVCLAHIHNKNQSLKNCQINIYQGRLNYSVCAPFDLRPDQEIDIPIMKIIVAITGPDIGRGYVVIAPYHFESESNKWESDMGWLPQPGKYTLKMLADNMQSIAMDFNLINNDEKWTVEPDVTR